MNLILDEDYYIIQQYTGVRDMNGNEIYEGDILQIATGACIPVSYDPMAAAFTIGDEMLYEMNFARDKVVGNIYENPELIDIK